MGLLPLARSCYCYLRCSSFFFFNTSLSQSEHLALQISLFQQNIQYIAHICGGLKNLGPGRQSWRQPENRHHLCPQLRPLLCCRSRLPRSLHTRISCYRGYISPGSCCCIGQEGVSMLLQDSSLSLSLSRLVQLMLSSLTYSGPREDSREPNWSSWSRWATTRRSSRWSHAQARGGGAAAVGGADVAPDSETAGLTHWVGPGAVVAAAVAAAELVLHSSFARPHASSFSSHCLVASFLT